MEKFSNFIKEALKFILITIVIVLIMLSIRAYVFEYTIVKGASMEDTLHDNEILFSYKLGYRYSNPQRGDIVIFIYKKSETSKYKFLDFMNNYKFLRNINPNFDDINYIKRVIAIPGDTVDIKEEDDYVYINGIKSIESYTKGSSSNNGKFSFPIKVPEGHIFVMGDNREHSTDSREIGLISFERIRGRAVFRLSPIKRLGKIY